MSGNTSELSPLPQILAQEASVTSVCPAGTQDSGKKGKPFFPVECAWLVPHLAVVDKGPEKQGMLSSPQEDRSAKEVPDSMIYGFSMAQ